MRVVVDEALGEVDVAPAQRAQFAEAPAGIGGDDEHRGVLGTVAGLDLLRQRRQVRDGASRHARRTPTRRAADVALDLAGRRLRRPAPVPHRTQLTLDPDEAGALAEHVSAASEDVAALARDPAVRAELQREVDEVNRRFGAHRAGQALRHPRPRPLAGGRGADADDEGQAQRGLRALRDTFREPYERGSASASRALSRMAARSPSGASTIRV
jgi:hypothetical protein